MGKEKGKTLYGAVSCVAVVNCGYFFQAVAHTLTGAMMANRLSYLGAAYSVLVMLLIIMDVCQIRRINWVTGILVGISTLAFLLAASGDWLGLYYKAVSITTVNGMTRLIKDYGPLHILYTVSIMGALALVGAVSNANGLFVENMWLFFFFNPYSNLIDYFWLCIKIKGIQIQEKHNSWIYNDIFSMYIRLVHLYVLMISFSVQLARLSSHNGFRYDYFFVLIRYP